MHDNRPLARVREKAHNKGTLLNKMLPCASVENAQQSLCRALSILCRVPKTHGKALVSRSD
jgi:hypothetical protein